MTKLDQIKAIREEYTGLRDLPRKSLASSIKTLADDLYAKDTHFIFELIQNAEDNDYQAKKRPSLRFEVCQQEIMGRMETILAVHNNEVGFQEKHVRAICQVGQSTKSKAQGYIGEKGIGFKSVFRITSSPYVFSNGFQFCLPEKDEETELGYIVPKWVENVPTSVSANETTIILPLNKNEKDIQSVSKALREIAPETILFLQKLTSLEISIRLPDAEYEVVAEKRLIRQSGASRLIELSYMQRGDSLEEDVIATSSYWLTEQEFNKPADIQHEKRDGIDTRVVSVAIPLNQQNHVGKLFAYLPVWEQTGLPFLINADFLLVSSREGIREDEEWNLWLRDCVAETFTTAFLALLTDKQLPLETRISAYSTIPLDTHRPFLRPVVDSIKKRLAELDCVLTLPDEKAVRPERARLCYETIRKLLGTPSSYPECLRNNFRLVCPEIEFFEKQLLLIGTKKFLLSDVKACLEDSDWVQAHPFPWFIDLIRFLKKESFENGDLHGYPIIPVGQHGKRKISRFSCAEEQPIYFPVAATEREAITATPRWLSTLVVIAFVHPDFHAELKKQEDCDDLQDWLTEQLDIYPFSAGNYAVDILNAISTKYENFSEEQLVEAANFLFLHSDGVKLTWDALPIVLADGRKMRLQEAKNLTFTDSGEKINAVVVPENFNPDAGWQHIWTTASDRKHFISLSKHYVSMPGKWFDMMKIVQYPPFHEITWRCWEIPKDMSYWNESYLLDQCRQSAAQSREYDSTVTSYEMPSSFTKVSCSKELSASLFNFLKNKGNLNRYYQAIGRYEYRGSHGKRQTSSLLEKIRSLPWLSTTKGLVAPREAFLPLPGIEEVLGKTVPYFIGELPEDALKLLNIQSEVSLGKLLEILKNNSGRKVDPELPQRIYKELNNRSGAPGGKSFISLAFAEKPLIFKEGGQNNSLWHKIGDCVWEDASEILGNDFTCLEHQYPRLRDFFIEIVGVKERVDTECFVKRLLALQEAPLQDTAQQRILIEKIYRKIKLVTKEPEAGRPAWWKNFHGKAKLYSQSDKFCEPDALLVPDDGELRRIFVKHDDVEFTWRPGDDSFNDWLPFYKAFGIPLLSESVTKRLEECDNPEYLGENTFVTVSAVQMIAAWLREKRRADYERLFSEKVFQQLFSLREERTEKLIRVGYHLETDSYEYGSKTEDYPVFWDAARNTLYYTSSAAKDQLAKELASGMLSADNQELASWIENVLESFDTKRLKRQGWSVPREISAMCELKEGSVQPTVDVSLTPIDSSGTDKPVLNIGETAKDATPKLTEVNTRCQQSPPTTPTTKHSMSPATTLHTSHSCATISTGPTISDAETLFAEKGNSNADNTPPTEPYRDDERQDSSSADSNQPPFVNFSDEIRNSFSQTGVTEINDRLDLPGPISVKNPDRRGQKIKDIFRNRIENEPASQDRHRPRNDTPLEEPSEEVRSSLFEWYRGHCQICGKTWAKRDGNSYFVAAYLVPRRHARLMDTVGNALCLCADHFAQWQHAAKEPIGDIPSQIDSLRLKAEGGNGTLAINFKMLGVECSISYDERHFLDLRALLSVTREVEKSPPCQT